VFSHPRGNIRVKPRVLLFEQPAINPVLFITRWTAELSGPSGSSWQGEGLLPPPTFGDWIYGVVIEMLTQAEDPDPLTAWMRKK
jgi:hypothetical protein